MELRQKIDLRKFEPQIGLVAYARKIKFVECDSKVTGNCLCGICIRKFPAYARDNMVCGI